MSGHVRHLYVHVPFCAHRCGYCDFVTVVGRRGDHGRYVEALLRELELESDVLAADVETVFLGGGTPTFLAPPALERLLGALPQARESRSRRIPRPSRGSSRRCFAAAASPACRSARRASTRASSRCSNAVRRPTTYVAPSR